MWRRAAAIAVLAGCCASDAAAETRFQGAAAVAEAGRFIDDAIAYGSDYDPGRVAVEFVTAYEWAFMTYARFAPSQGHQVILSKGPTETGEGGARCAGFRVSVEHFTAASLAALARNVHDAVLAVDTVDTVYGTICRHGADDVRVAVREVAIARAAEGRNAFSSPFTSGPPGGPGGGF
jgi:hypothetical protein